MYTKTTLLDFNLKMEHIKLNMLELGSLGEIGLIISANKFIELSELIQSANYSIQESQKTNNSYLKSYFLKYAILNYNACYDYFEQIVFFAFDFFPDFGSAREYKKILKECTRSSIRKKGKDSTFTTDIMKLKKVNSEARLFFDKYDKERQFVNHTLFGIRKWANSIKHQGGINFSECEKDYGYIICQNSHGDTLFTTKSLKTYQITNEQIYTNLFQQNEKIVEITRWLFNYIFGDISCISCEPKLKRFSANKNHFKGKRLAFYIIDK